MHTFIFKNNLVSVYNMFICGRINASKSISFSFVKLIAGSIVAFKKGWKCAEARKQLHKMVEQEKLSTI